MDELGLTSLKTATLSFKTAKHLRHNQIEWPWGLGDPFLVFLQMFTNISTMFPSLETVVALKLCHLFDVFNPDSQQDVTALTSHIEEMSQT
jgi:hypothetical protein